MRGRKKYVDLIRKLPKMRGRKKYVDLIRKLSISPGIGSSQSSQEQLSLQLPNQHIHTLAYHDIQISRGLLRARHRSENDRGEAMTGRSMEADSIGSTAWTELGHSPGRQQPGQTTAWADNSLGKEPDMYIV
jgi:hypothetical protein